MTLHTNRPASLLPTWTPAALRRSACASLTACLLLAVGTAACSKGGDDKVSVAQVAVRANPDLELMATDAQQGVLTVRVKKTEQVLTVKVDDVIAGTAFANLQAAAAAPEAAPAAAPASSGSRLEITTPGAKVSMGGGADGKSTVAVEAGGTRASASGGSGEVGSARERLREAGRALGSTLPADAPAPRAAAPAPAAEPAPAPAPAPRRDEATLRRRTSPVLCNGKDSVRLENVLLETDSVAVSANGHCNILISGSHIIGRMGGVSVNGNATVTIENSQIEAPVAFSVNGDGEISVEGSRIEGAVQSRRKTSVRDLGRNVWR